ncbi:hypothetical protein HMPREF9997_00668 [Corynebacterium durum F0235]|uniref:Uncharacterized protein n=1 Tax=Corynebacterium durum F0235 TaxID=1035195 RepID=L1MKV0_9CORY|nr:hypothetical protein HMPREF9997_00668 [Corynebacterium durum F0235]
MFHVHSTRHTPDTHRPVVVVSARTARKTLSAKTQSAYERAKPSQPLSLAYRGISGPHHGDVGLARQSTHIPRRIQTHPPKRQVKTHLS